MARKIKVEPASQESVNALESEVRTLADRMDRRMDSGFRELKVSLESTFNSTLARFAADVDRRFAKTATVDMLSDVKATVDRHTVVLDHIVGVLRDLQESRLVFSAMYKNHDHRIPALESRQAPPTPL